MVPVKCPSMQTGWKCIKNSSRCKVNTAPCNGKPFLIFVTHFRKNQKVRDYHLSDSQCLRIAGKVWNRMSVAEKQPYVNESRNFNYVFKSRNKKVNWVIKKLRQVVADGQLHLRRLWELAAKMAAWNRCVMDKIQAQEDEMKED
ncbi:uncharacterized protein Dvir_GJ21829 [Drosophila virilis]|uniref:HMG box domain-containing protein n=1 Tax=Drosophila virilis TaxID=7244 RepID=A0A0Q9W3V2_DROVI|nr:uncharacterized protein LOC6625653 isoform X1 [Drosophila virilis]KRF79747.1 uncharacterized protein Dvir_GJ21829 [Drosophila virilis]